MGETPPPGPPSPTIDILQRPVFRQTRVARAHVGAASALLFSEHKRSRAAVFWFRPPSAPFNFVRDTVFSRRRVSLTRLARFCFVRTCVQRPPDATLQSEMPAHPLTSVTRGRRADHCDPHCPSSRDIGKRAGGTKWAKGRLLLFPASFNRNILSVAVITAPPPLPPFF